jgi:alpha-tubulin suppressor-like RCC1 family protein
MNKQRILIFCFVLIIVGINGVILANRFLKKSQPQNNDSPTPKLMSWGYDRFGQLGVDLQKVTDKDNPEAIIQFDQPVKKLAAGLGHSMALAENGDVYSWGNNSNGQLGLGSLDNKATPQKVPTLSKVKDIAASQFHSLALDENGKVWAWGLNWSGQLGDGTYRNSQVPVQVKELSDVSTIGTGYRFSYALKNDGTVWVWGADCEHNNETNYRKIIESFSGSLDIAGSYFDADESNVDEFNEAANCIGENWINIKSNVPVQVTSLSEIKQVSAGYGHLMALKNDGTVWAWGCNKYGQLGIGKTGNSDDVKIPQQVPGLPPVKTLSAGFRHSVAVDQDGKVWGWGYNRWGQAGSDKGTDDVVSPVLVTGVEKVKTIMAGLDYTLMIDENDELWGVGTNSFLKLSPAAPPQVFLPLKIHENWKFDQVLTGAAHVLAVGTKIQTNQ